MCIRDIWGKLNVSTLLVLPLYSDLTEGVFAFKSKIRFPLIQLAFECGLLQTYLYSDYHKKPHRFHLVFDREKVTKKMRNTSALYHSLNEMIIDYRYFQELNIVNDCMVYTLSIPRYWRRDVAKIEQGRYFEVSKKCKERLCVNERFPTYPFVENELGHFLVEKNLPYAIVMKAKNLREDIEEIIKQSIPPGQEYFDRMDLRKETLTPKIIENIWSEDHQLVGI